MRLWPQSFSLLWLCAGVAPGALADTPWKFDTPLEVTGKPVAGIFHHLESAGRKNVAAAEDRVAVVWEDNHSGAPQVYISERAGSGAFGSPRRLSNGAEAYEPSLVWIPQHGFFVGWEQDGHAVVAMIKPEPVIPVRLAGNPGSGQVSLAVSKDGKVHAVWSAQTANGRRIMYSKIDPAREMNDLPTAKPVDKVSGNFDQLYPSVAVAGDRVTVAWEDRRAGHTRIRVTHNSGNGYSASRPLNELPPPMSSVFGKGTGASRVALAALVDGETAAVWADKRNFRSGYDVYAAIIDSKGVVGANEKVQDEFGAVISQWHPAVAGGKQAVAAWDDDRDGSPDIILSWRTQNGWSEDLPLPGASGPGVQSDPSIAVDTQGILHIAWIYRVEDGGPTGIRYLQGRPFENR